MDVALLIKIGFTAILSIIACASIFLYFYIWKDCVYYDHDDLFAAVMFTLLYTIVLIFAVIGIIVMITA